MEIARLEIGGRRSVISLVDRGSIFGGATGETVVIADENTRHLVEGASDLPLIVVPAGERCKSFAVARSVVDNMLERRLTREARVLGVGGGAVTDLAAFVASLYLRGVDVVLVPTSLLAMVDAAIGGKTGVNAGPFKNMVGSFYAASQIRVVPGLLESLPDVELMSGLAEVIKAALLGDETLLELLETNRELVLARDGAVTERIIVAAVHVKVRYVAEDFTERGVRAHLNLGHTFAHALESVAGFGTIPHGAAVAWGINRALRAGVGAGKTSRAYADRVRSLLLDYGYQLDYPDYNAVDLIAAMEGDKKRNRSGVQFVLQRDATDTFVAPLDTSVLRSVLESSG